MPSPREPGVADPRFRREARRYAPGPPPPPLLIGTLVQGCVEPPPAGRTATMRLRVKMAAVT